MKRSSTLIAALFFLHGALFAQDDEVNVNTNKNGKETRYEFVKKKAVNKSYNISSSDKLNIRNSFGMVEVHTWDKSEIKVDVDVEVTANSDAFAQKIIDRISVTDEQNGKDISFKTNLKDVNNSKGDKSTMKINYSIYMPSSNPLQIKNEFGKTIIPDYKGEIDLTSKFGQLNTGNLSNIKNINVEFGKASFGNMPGGNMNIKYSSATFSKLTGNVKLNFEFCSKVVLNLDNNLTGLDLKVSYSTVNIKPLNDLPASYNISTSFGSFKNKTNIKFDSDEDEDNGRGPKFDHEYSGKSRNGNVPVKVKSNFSTIILGDASDEDFQKDKNKEKNKSKSVSI